jgi:hypothetical protein
MSGGYAVISGPVTIQVTIPSAQVLTSNTTPVILIAAPGAGYYINVINIKNKMLFRTAAYTTNLGGRVGFPTATINAFNLNDILDATLTKRTQPPIITDTATVASVTQYLENQPLQYTTATGNPAAGDGDLVIDITFQILPF